MKFRTMLLGAMISIAAGFTPALSQEYPTKPIKIIVPFAPGATDPIVRALVPSMSAELGKPIVIENQDGAGGAIGTTAVKNASADGYTLLFTNYSSMGIIPQIRNVSYSKDDFLPLGTVTGTPLVLAARKEVPYNDAKSLVEFAKANPKAVKVGHAGLGSASHLDAEVLQFHAKAKFLFVPYRGVANAQLALLSGDVDLLFAYPSVVAPHVEAGKVKIIALADEERFPLLPDVPTFREAGLPVFDNLKAAIFAPKNIPSSVAKKLEVAIANAVKSAEFQDYIKKSQSGALYYSSEDSVKAVNAYYDYWKENFAENDELMKSLK